MSQCKRARDLFGPCWDDELSLAEREWLEGHLAACGECRREYEGYSRTLEVLGSLPRQEAAESLVEDVLARVRHATPAADMIGRRQVFASDRPAWIPVAATAGVALLAFAAIVPWMLPRPGGSAGPVAVQAPAPAVSAPVAQPRLVSAPAPVVTAAPARSSGTEATRAARGAMAVLSDSLFDHTEDVEFILDPVTLHRGRARTVSRLPQGVQGEQAVITF